MDIVKVTTSGQISIPKNLELRLRRITSCVLLKTEVTFLAVETENNKFTMEDLKNGILKAKILKKKISLAE